MPSIKENLIWGSNLMYWQLSKVCDLYSLHYYFDLQYLLNDHMCIRTFWTKQAQHLYSMFWVKMILTAFIFKSVVIRMWWLDDGILLFVAATSADSRHIPCICLYGQIRLQSNNWIDEPSRHNCLNSPDSYNISNWKILTNMKIGHLDLYKTCITYTASKI